MSTSLAALKNIAAQLRIDSVRSTSEAGTGHPTTCLSAADIVSTLFFDEMRFDAKNPRNPDNDRFILSKGHAAPILYSAWAEAGLFPREELLKLRQIGSDLEGHPTPRLSFVDVATGSLGQGICAAIGTALNARRIGSEYRTYVLCGDGEMAEGSVWEAADVAIHFKLDNLCGIIDVNGLGQSQDTQFGHDMEAIAARWNAFGWHAIVVDGHDIPALQKAFAEARTTKGRPTMVLARTLKGKGLADIEGKPGWHGKALKKGEETDRAVAELQKQISGDLPRPEIQGPALEKPCRNAARLLEGAGTCLQEGGFDRHSRSVGGRPGGGRQGRYPRRRARRGRQEFNLQRQVRKGRAGSLLRELHRRAGHGWRRDGAGGPRRDSVPLDLRVLPDAARATSSGWAASRSPT